MTDFQIRADARSQTGIYVMLGLSLTATIGLFVSGAIAHVSGMLVCGAMGLVYSLYTVYLLYSSKYIEYEDEGDHLRISFGPGSCFNCIMNTCGTWTTHTSGVINYADIEQMEYIESTSCCDGCGLNRNHSRDIVYTTDCCVPALVIHSKNSSCCFSGRTVLGVWDEQQAQELITGIDKKMTKSIV